ncbi:MAG: GTPase HflX [Parvularculaceae bacterium]
MGSQIEDNAAHDFGAAFVVHVAFAGDERLRSASARLEEACGLAEAINLKVARREIVTVSQPRPSTLIGAGRVGEIREQLDAADPRPGLVIVDAALSPVQHRNLENEWNAKVLDRTGLILEIFGARAHTAEGRLQVDLAHLSYQKSRLVRSWTHLERQRGGGGFLGGPGERQIESDRRAIQEKIDRLKNRLERVRRTRNLQRAKRKKAPHPVVALVGYTNAGKSTLFNRMTESAVVARDQLFATLDPTMRAVDLPSGQRVILSDTVGFISDLPTQLIAAFRATLEEVNEADLLLHVRDASHDDSDAQRADVISVLKELGVDSDSSTLVIEVMNKIDLLNPEDKLSLQAIARLTHDCTTLSIDEPVKVCVSAVSGEGMPAMLELVDRVLTADRSSFVIELASQNGAARAWLHANGDVREELAVDDIVRFDVRLTDKARGQFQKLYADAKITTQSADNARLSA